MKAPAVRLAPNTSRSGLHARRQERRVRLVILVTCVALVGCLGAPKPPGGPVALRDVPGCHDGEPSASGNAPLTAGFEGSHEDVLARLAAAVGVHRTSAPVEYEPGRWTQWTDDGELRYEQVAGQELYGPEVYLAWTGNRTWAPAPAEAAEWVAALATAFGADRASLEVDATGRSSGPGHVVFWQAVEDRPLGGTGGSLRAGIPGVPRPALDLHGLRALPAAPLEVDESEARAIALPHARCVLDAGGRTTEAGYATLGVEGFEQIGVHGDSIVRGVLVRFSEPGEPSHCGMAILVRVDAMTGDVLAAGRPPCD